MSFTVLAITNSKRSPPTQEVELSHFGQSEQHDSRDSSSSNITSHHDAIYEGNSIMVNRSNTNFRSNFSAVTKMDAKNESAVNLMNGLDNPDEFPDGGFKAWSVAIGSLFGLTAAFGIMNTTGAIQAYISKHQLKDSSLSQISWIFSIYSFMAFSGSIFTGPLFDRFGSRALLIGGTVSMFLGIFLTGECTEVYQFILSFGILNGLGGALLQTPLYGVVSHWFSKNRASALGLASIGGSLGGVISPLILRSLYPKVGFKWAMRILSFVYLAFLVISYVLIEDRAPPKAVVTESERSDEEDTAAIDPHTPTYKKLLFRLKNVFDQSVDFRIFRNKSYFHFVVALILTEFSLVLTLTYLSSYAIAHGQTESTSFLLLTILNLSGIPGRWIPGYLADKFGRFNLMVISCIFMSLSMFVLWFPFGKHIGVLYTFSVVYGYSSASILSLSPVCCSQLVAAQNFGKAYGTAYFCVSFIDLFGLVLGSLVIGSGTTKEYSYLALMASILATVGTMFWGFSRIYVGGWRLIKC